MCRCGMLAFASKSSDVAGRRVRSQRQLRANEALTADTVIGVAVEGGPRTPAHRTRTAAYRIFAGIIPGRRVRDRRQSGSTERSRTPFGAPAARHPLGFSTWTSSEPRNQSTESTPNAGSGRVWCSQASNLATASSRRYRARGGTGRSDHGAGAAVIGCTARAAMRREATRQPRNCAQCRWRSGQSMVMSSRLDPFSRVVTACGRHRRRMRRSAAHLA